MMPERLPRLVIVIPCYNEEDVLLLTASSFAAKIKELAETGKIAPAPLSRILYVNDGSRDRTWELICSLTQQNPVYSGISLSRNRGHQNALLAGLMEARGKCDITISIDCDGQDDINAMNEMVEAYHNGAEVVYGVRNDRSTDSFLKRCTAHSYYRLLNLMGAEVVYDHSDYRLLSERVLDSLAEYKEVNIYLRGLIPLVGFNSTIVCYKRGKRLAGKSHYSISKMIGLAMDGITSLSIKPIRIITGLGVVIFFISMLLIIYSFIVYFNGDTIRGWTSNMMVICAIGGIQMISLGVIGEYIGKIYLETKQRPRYTISDRTDADKEE